jgi:hypothetical protein
MKCNKTQCKWCKNKHGASKIIDTFETYQSSSRGLEEEECHARLEAERRSKFNDERASRRPEAGTSHGKKQAGESSAPPPPA